MNAQDKNVATKVILFMAAVSLLSGVGTHLAASIIIDANQETAFAFGLVAFATTLFTQMKVIFSEDEVN